jgi:MarR family transcriptional regulator, 2-MHQ and catechol-resistance regulon repressor
VGESKYLEFKIMPSVPDNLAPTIPGVRVWLILWKAASAVQAYSRASIEALEMCLSDFMVLEVLLHRGPLPVNIIGQKVLLTSGSMTTSVDRLEHRGLVLRQTDPFDGRVTLVHLTKEGRKLIEKAFSRHAAGMEQLVADWGEEERRQFIESLKRIGFKAATTLKTRK